MILVVQACCKQVALWEVGCRVSVLGATHLTGWHLTGCYVGSEAAVRRRASPVWAGMQAPTLTQFRLLCFSTGAAGGHQHPGSPCTGAQHRTVLTAAGTMEAEVVVALAVVVLR